MEKQEAIIEKLNEIFSTQRFTNFENEIWGMIQETIQQAIAVGYRFELLKFEEEVFEKLKAEKTDKYSIEDIDSIKALLILIDLYENNYKEDTLTKESKDFEKYTEYKIQEMKIELLSHYRYLLKLYGFTIKNSTTILYSPVGGDPIIDYKMVYYLGKFSK
jgi:hypothetical protein